MKVFLLQDVLNVGMAGEVVNVSDGFAVNYLLPHKLGIMVNKNNSAEFANRLQKIEHRKEVVQSKTSMLAERIKSVVVTIKRKLHDEGKLYGSLSEQEVVDALAGAGISVAKSQVVFDKSIKSKGSYPVTIRLSSTLQPACTVRVVSEE
jgi:large subunit ribosomal protein L9